MPKKVKIITVQNRLLLASNRIKKKYERQRQKGRHKKVNKKASKWLKRAGYLDTDDLETINYNNIDSNMDDIETVGYNNDTNINDLNNINLKKHQGTTIGKKMIKKYRNLSRKKHMAGLIRKHKRTLFFSNRYLSIQEIGLQGKEKIKLRLLNRYLSIPRKCIKEKEHLKATASQIKKVKITIKLLLLNRCWFILP